MPLVGDILSQPALLDHEDVGPHLARLVAEPQRFTFFEVSHRDKLGAPTRGSRPGCGAADYLFNVVFARLLKMVEVRLADHGLLYRLDDARDRPGMCRAARAAASQIAGATYVDDVMAPTILENMNVIRHLHNIMGILPGSFVAHFMEPNYGRGKTGALVQLRGPQRGLLRAILDQDEVQVLANERNGFEFYVARQCNHMGDVISFDGSMRPEIARRVQRRDHALGPIRRAIVPRRAVPITSKVRYVEALACSRLFQR
eukprot:9486698-Pyramimonas_sp.AAC.1